MILRRIWVNLISIVMMATVLSGCAIRDTLDARGIMEYKVDTEECKYKNGIFALKYNEDKLSVSEPFRVGNEVICGVDIISDKIITGDSQILIIADLNQSMDADSIEKEMDTFIKNKMNIKDEEISNRLDSDVTQDKNYLNMSSSFECGDSRYTVKMMYKWNCLLTVCAEYVEDKGNNDYIREAYDSIKFIGTDTTGVKEF